MENSQDGALGTLTSLIQHFGLAYFPVTDAQGNIRGYANTSGVQSAYAYYPYGTLIDLAHDNAEDSRRWQSKEFDSDINKYYFGARFSYAKSYETERKTVSSAKCYKAKEILNFLHLTASHKPVRLPFSY